MSLKTSRRWCGLLSSTHLRPRSVPRGEPIWLPPFCDPAAPAETELKTQMLTAARCHKTRGRLIQPCCPLTQAAQHCHISMNTPWRFSSQQYAQRDNHCRGSCKCGRIFPRAAPLSARYQRLTRFPRAPAPRDRGRTKAQIGEGADIRRFDLSFDPAVSCASLRLGNPSCDSLAKSQRTLVGTSNWISRSRLCQNSFLERTHYP
mmetsp:Transcript_14204/g.33175  ORF Transcript_14204/g.33175 Transcript_14204/m.33175 type:complete len:204 (-) Transcript_14204:891-1502(-)